MMRNREAQKVIDDPHEILDQGEPVNISDLYENGMIEIARLEGGASFGEEALVENKYRQCTIKCTQRTHFLTISVKDYHKFQERLKDI